jgi:hypothetical protein
MPDEEFDMLGEDELVLLTETVREAARELGEHEEEYEDLLPVQQAGTLRR